MEQWKPIEGTDGKYLISNHGRVRTNKQRPGIMTTYRQSNGYIYVNLWLNGKNKCLKVTRLVAQTFIPNPNNYPVVNHKDGNKENNHSSNLEWTTYAGNTQHAFRTGLQRKHVPDAEERARISNTLKKFWRDKRNGEG